MSMLRLLQNRMIHYANFLIRNKLVFGSFALLHILNLIPAKIKCSKCFTFLSKFKHNLKKNLKNNNRLKYASSSWLGIHLYPPPPSLTVHWRPLQHLHWAALNEEHLHTRKHCWQTHHVQVVLRGKTQAHWFHVTVNVNHSLL